MAEQLGIIEESKEAIMDNEHSIGEKVPGSPFVIVALSYLGILAIACAGVGTFIWLAT